MPSVPITLAEKDVTYLNTGRSLLNVWGKLSTPEKDKLKKLMNSENLERGSDGKLN